ncbi:hypothetical protein F2Q70_00003052 [Brassica cretica]|uniref:Uncharacterized protein n=1 Tax=Brassica cretica TaxID=69181 RepID=A0A3N6S4P7_BRACR|nr:hypothetical protein F2Q70_00003052 [Brassica cretica]KAF3569510.1 hypothetical protein DY000_02014732 [Brassica cretica]
MAIFTDKTEGAPAIAVRESTNLERSMAAFLSFKIVSSLCWTKLICSPLRQYSSPSVSNSGHNLVTIEISVLEAYGVEKEESSHEESQPQPSLLSAVSPSHYIS